jgi:hypothetical protein
LREQIKALIVVRGTDNGIYWNSYNFFGIWGSWQSLGGATLSAPGICELAGSGRVDVIVRGSDNGVYSKSWTSASGWSANWLGPPGGGRTIDTPACAYLGGVLFVVVRGSTGNELWWNSLSSGGVWSGWQDLHGASASAPVLISIPIPFGMGASGEIDLFVRGTDNGIYHKQYLPAYGWSNWNSPGGATLSRPAAAHYFIQRCTPGCDWIDSILVVVRGTDNNVYVNFYTIALNYVGPPTGWGTWSSLNGQTLSAPTLASFDNGCSSASVSSCNSVGSLAVRGTDNAVYHKTLTTVWSGWDSPGGMIANSPALAYIPGSSGEFLLLVEGYPSIYANTVTGSTWNGYSTVGGATNSDPALTAVL